MFKKLLNKIIMGTKCYLALREYCTELELKCAELEIKSKDLTKGFSSEDFETDHDMQFAI